MFNYTFIYWPLPFRGNFVRNLFACAGVGYREISDYQQIIELKSQPVMMQPCPFMGPPVLIDHRHDLALSQMAAIVMYLGDQFDLMPHLPAERAIVLKLLGDCTDILADMTRQNGAQMWTLGEWETFQNERLVRWLQILEETARRSGATEKGLFWERNTPQVPDLALHSVFATMARCLPELTPLLWQHAPLVMGICDRVDTHPGIQALVLRQVEAFGQVYCGGQIEDSIRSMLNDACAKQT